MNKSIVEIIRDGNSKYRKFLIMNEITYQMLKRELGMEDYEELFEFKNLTICISKNNTLGLILV
jgi:hypothetical protein